MQKQGGKMEIKGKVVICGGWNCSCIYLAGGDSEYLKWLQDLMTEKGWTAYVPCDVSELHDKQPCCGAPSDWIALDETIQLFSNITISVDEEDVIDGREIRRIAEAG